MTVNEVLRNGKEASYLYNYLFHFNPYRKKWMAIPKGELSSYFNGEANNIISSKIGLRELIKKVIKFELKCQRELEKLIELKCQQRKEI